MRPQTNPLQAVCYDHHSLVTGSLDQVSEQGCEIVSPGGQGACFARKARVVLNLFDPKTGSSMSVGARIATIYRREGLWAYRLRWEQVPGIVAGA